MGHSGYLTDAYRRFTKAQIAEYYLKGEYLVSLSIPTQAISQVEERLEREKTIMFDRIVSLEKQMEEFQVIAKTIRG